MTDIDVKSLLAKISLPSLGKWRKHDIVGIDWGSRELKWMKLKAEGTDRYSLSFLDILPLPEK